jgi:undecaprenyl-diphosphatase
MGESMVRWMLKPDMSLMRRANRWQAPRWIRYWALAATRGGDGWLWYGTGALVLLFGGDGRWQAAGTATIAGILSVALFLLLKRMTPRTRPCYHEPHCWASLTPPDLFSFPSGHSMSAFAIAVSLGQYYPALLPALLFCAGNVAVSRILLGMHFLSDVIVGSALGGALGYWIFQTLQ